MILMNPYFTPSNIQGNTTTTSTAGRSVGRDPGTNEADADADGAPRRRMCSAGIH